MQYKILQVFMIAILLTVSFQVMAQDSMRINLANLFWENEIEVLSKDNKVLSFDRSIGVITNQTPIMNCFSPRNWYYQNIGVFGGEYLIFPPFGNCKKIKMDALNYKITTPNDPDTGEEKEHVLLKYRLVGEQLERLDVDTSLSEFMDKTLKIEKFLFRDTLEKRLDACQIEYKLMLNSDQSFTQEYGAKNSTNCEVNGEELKEAYKFGSGKINATSHKLYGNRGLWKIKENKLYLKFENGIIYSYYYLVDERNLILRNSETTILLGIN